MPVGFFDEDVGGTPGFAVGAPLASDVATEAGRAMLVFGGGW